MSKTVASQYASQNKILDHFNEAFAGHLVPSDIRDLSMSLCLAYGINGICDPMYISNLVALKLGRGDGKGNFF